MADYAAYVGLDVHKDSIAVAVADAGRDGEVRFWGGIPNTAEAIDGLVKKLAARHGVIEYVYEAGPCGYGVYRQLTAKGHACRVISPGHTPKKAGSHQERHARCDHAGAAAPSG